MKFQPDVKASTGAARPKVSRVACAGTGVRQVIRVVK